MLMVPSSSSPADRRGFTLIELLVVIAVIAVLVGVLVPVIGLIRGQAKEVQCRNNLQQVGTGIAAFRADNQNRFPATLTSMFSTGAVMAGESGKVLLCPLDIQKGTDDSMGRPKVWGNISQLFETGSSYIFEASGRTLGSPEKDWMFDASRQWKDIGSTWGDVKAYQLTHGRHDGTAFNPGEFPILRCFWHYAWPQTQAGSKSTVQKVLNLSWDYRVFLSIPYWEHQADPAIPIP